MAHKHVVGAVDDRREWAEPGGWGLIAVREEVGATTTNGVVGGGGMDHFLDV